MSVVGSPNNPAAEKKAQIETACTTAEEFCTLFYDKMDNKRHTIDKLYLDTATLSWNGNKVDGKSVQKSLGIAHISLYPKLKVTCIDQ